jgi:hypothetical protein
MTNSILRALFAAGALSALAAASGCVTDRPSRNGVFNENQYVRKAFLTTDGTHDDPGWFYKATVTQVSTPNALGEFWIFTGISNALGGPLGYAKWNVTQDKLQLTNLRQIESTGSDDNTPEVLNAWPIENVDLKYRVNLDGEKTNYYEENQELDWQVRQWVKLSFSKNDMSDVAALGAYATSALEKCTDVSNASTTLVPNSFHTEDYDDWTKDYMEFAVQVTVPLRFDDSTCVDMYGSGYEGLSDLGFGRVNQTFTLKYSFMRAKALDDPTTNPNAYVPLVLDEKDPIRHKYGYFEIINMSRDPETRLLAARELVERWNPNKPVTYYFLPGTPTYIVDAFLGHRVYDNDDAQGADSAQLCLTAGCHRNQDGVQDRTNQVFAQAGAKIRLTFLNHDDATTFGDARGPERTFGDARYSFIHWIPDIDENNNFLGLAGGAADPRTGEILSAELNLSDHVVGAMAYEIDFFLQSVGASQGLGYSDPNGNAQEWPPTPPGVSSRATCTVGQTVPLQNAVIQANHDGGSSLFTKMQQYLGKPAGTYGNLGPQDFIAKQDQDFFNAYYALVPYVIFMDPDANPFVQREGGAGIYSPPALANFWQMADQEAEFHRIAADIDRGLTPYNDVTGPDGLQNATAFIDHFRDLTVNHRDYGFMKGYLTSSEKIEPVDALSMTQIAEHAARHCVADADGSTHWETKAEWIANLQHSFYEQIAIHEFGHTLGLRHNFMGSVDRPNYPVKTDAMGNTLKDANGNPLYSLYTSSVMEYTARIADIFDVLEWGAYDKGALAWGYTNNAPKPMDPNAPAATSISGQLDATHPWNDPLGFQTDHATEIQFMRCTDQNVKLTPLCRTFDAGATPSEIIANDIDNYEWSYNFANYRVYRKFWDNSHYADRPASFVMDTRRFMLLWQYDWNSGNIADTLRRIGFQIPRNVPALQYYQQLENKFNNELSSAGQLAASFHKAIIQQSTGERPAATIYDSFYGDVTQQGIILDKFFAMEGWVGIWPGTYYDPNKAGKYWTSYSNALDASYQAVAEDAVDSMIGGQYDAFPYFAPLAVSLFAQDTHDPNFTGRIDIRNWIGGHVFSRVEDFLAYFRDIASQNYYQGASPDGTQYDCTHGFDACLYDPRPFSDKHNELIGPDKRLWSWAYLPDRNEYVALQKEVNTASYVIIRAYNDDVVYNLDDGAFPGKAFSAELPMKYYLDSFTQYN